MSLPCTLAIRDSFKVMHVRSRRACLHADMSSTTTRNDGSKGKACCLTESNERNGCRHESVVTAVEYYENDLESVSWLCQRYVMQNIGTRPRESDALLCSAFES